MSFFSQRAARLEVHAGVVLTRIDGDREVGIFLECAYPGSVEPDFRHAGCGEAAVAGASFLDEIDRRFAGLRLRESVWGGVLRYGEGDILRAAGGFDVHRLVLRECGC